MVVQRRLTADVAGYSRLMGEDEQGTLTTFNAAILDAIVTDLRAAGLPERSRASDQRKNRQDRHPRWPPEGGSTGRVASESR